MYIIDYIFITQATQPPWILIIKRKQLKIRACWLSTVECKSSERFCFQKVGKCCVGNSRLFHEGLLLQGGYAEYSVKGLTWNINVLSLTCIETLTLSEVYHKLSQHKHCLYLLETLRDLTFYWRYRQFKGVLQCLFI